MWSQTLPREHKPEITETYLSFFCVCELKLCRHSRTQYQQEGHEFNFVSHMRQTARCAIHTEAYSGSGKQGHSQMH